MKWRLINSGYLDGYANMALDEAMFTLRATNNVAPTLRLYGWAPPAVSIGYFQKLEEVELGKGVDVVKRLTGGGAILHDQELTFCLVAQIKDFPVLGEVSRSYNVISRAIISGLKTLGIAVRIRGDEKSQAESSKANAFFCFARPSKYDVVFKEKKLVGSAQRRRDGALLHHGSILLEEPRKTLPLDGTTSINSLLGRKVKFEELKRYIVRGFEEELSIELVPGELTKDELELSKQLAKQKRKEERG